MTTTQRSATTEGQTETSVSSHPKASIGSGDSHPAVAPSCAHTPGPWVTYGHATADEQITKCEIRGAAGEFIGDVESEACGGDAARIVACVNACEGIATDALGKFPGGKVAEILNGAHLAMEMLRTLRAQRDELADALDDIAADAESTHGDDHVRAAFRSIRRRASRALDRSAATAFSSAERAGTLAATKAQETTAGHADHTGTTETKSLEGQP